MEKPGFEYLLWNSWLDINVTYDCPDVQGELMSRVSNANLTNLFYHFGLLELEKNKPTLQGSKHNATCYTLARLAIQNLSTYVVSQMGQERNYAYKLLKSALLVTADIPELRQPLKNAEIHEDWRKVFDEIKQQENLSL
jgi:hypothetical protein